MLLSRYAAQSAWFSRLVLDNINNSGFITTTLFITILPHNHSGDKMAEDSSGLEKAVKALVVESDNAGELLRLCADGQTGSAEPLVLEAIERELIRIIDTAKVGFIKPIIGLLASPGLPENMREYAENALPIAIESAAAKRWLDPLAEVLSEKTASVGLPESTIIQAEHELDRTIHATVQSNWTTNIPELLDRTDLPERVRQRIENVLIEEIEIATGKDETGIIMSILGIPNLPINVRRIAGLALNSLNPEPPGPSAEVATAFATVRASLGLPEISQPSTTAGKAGDVERNAPGGRATGQRGNRQPT